MMARIEIEECSYVNETPDAILLEDANGNLIWVPKQFADWDEDEGVLVIEEWLAKDRGLI